LACDYMEYLKDRIEQVAVRHQMTVYEVNDGLEGILIIKSADEDAVMLIRYGCRSSSNKINFQIGLERVEYRREFILGDSAGEKDLEDLVDKVLRCERQMLRMKRTLR